MKKRLLVVKEKDVTRYFLIPNLKTLRAISLRILRQRYKDGWYGTIEEYKKLQLDASLDLEQLRNLNLTGARRQEHLIKVAEQEWEVCTKQLCLLGWIRDALRAKSGAQAYDLLRRRSVDHCEYETVEIRDFER